MIMFIGVGHARQGDVHGQGVMHGKGVCVAERHVWQGACLAGGRAWQGRVWQERWPLQRAVHILLECILVVSFFHPIITM